VCDTGTRYEGDPRRSGPGHCCAEQRIRRPRVAVMGARPLGDLARWPTVDRRTEDVPGWRTRAGSLTERHTPW
jgi:hypothetical protein